VQSAGADSENGARGFEPCIHIPMIFKNGLQEWSFAEADEPWVFLGENLASVQSGTENATRRHLTLSLAWILAFNCVKANHTFFVAWLAGADP
jgi:hypothetical protein